MNVFPLFAQVENVAWNWQLLGWHVFEVIVYVALGLALFGLAYLLVDKCTPFSLGQELLEKKNTAIAIVLGAIFLAIALILTAAIRG